MAKSTRQAMGYKHPTVRCSVGGCNNPLTARTFCEKHYKRWQQHGDPNFLLQSNCKGKICSTKGCEKPRRKQEWCNSHYTINWQLRNPERTLKNRRHANYLRHTRKRNAEGSHTRQEWEALLERYEGMCAYCQTNPAESRDHIIPISRKGTDYIENILPACLTCNKSRGAKPLLDWLREKDYINTFDNYRAIYNGRVYEA